MPLSSLRNSPTERHLCSGVVHRVPQGAFRCDAADLLLDDAGLRPEWKPERSRFLKSPEHHPRG